MTRIGTLAMGMAALLLGGSVVFAGPAREAQASPIYGVTLPKGYRDWKLISVAQENGKNDDIRAILGNAIAVKAFRDGKRPFPDGAVIVRLAWHYQASPRNDAVFPAPQSFVAGAPTNVQVSVKNAKRYGATGGCLQVLSSEGRALWMLYSLPLSAQEALRRKAAGEI